MAARFVFHGDASEVRSQDLPSRASFATIKPAPAPHRSFATRMTMMFASTAILTALALVVVLALVWEGQFKQYTRQNMQQVANSTAGQISEAYAQAHGWTETSIHIAEVASSVSSDIGVQLISADGTVLYDDTWANGIADKNSAPTTHVKVEETIPQGSENIVSADVISSDGQIVGSVRVWAFGTESFLTKADATFRSNSYMAIGIAALAAVFLSSIIGYIASHQLTRPIAQITKTAASIRNGDLTARVQLHSNDEIGRLAETFDDMATSLERDLKLEHRLTSDVAHELRTPLMALQATVEAMQDGVLPADDEHFETIAAEIRRLSRLVDAMLKLSRLENGSMSVNIERTDVVNLIKGLVSAQHQLFHESGLHLRFEDDTPRGECIAECDPDLIREAAVNLLSNAMRYTNEGGWIIATVGISKGDAVISVKDTGIGIAKEDIPQTFSRFWRSDVSRERVSGGLGVGLSITKEIIDRHNGTISVESEVGKGTTFSLHIPLKARKDRHSALIGAQTQESDNPREEAQDGEDA